MAEHSLIITMATRTAFLLISPSLSLSCVCVYMICYGVLIVGQLACRIVNGDVWSNAGCLPQPIMSVWTSVEPVDSSYLGASGTSTPSRDGAAAQNKDGAAAASKRDSYKSTALEEIRRSIQTFKKDESKDSDSEVRADR